MNGVAQRRPHPRQADAARDLRGDGARRSPRSPRGAAASGAHGICRTPTPLTTNLAKYTFATGYHEAIELVQDCAGGLLVTGPGGDDWDSPEVRAGAREVLPRRRRRPRIACAMMNLISDLTVRDFGGYHAVLAVHAEGSIEAEKMQILRAYDPRAALGLARRLAGLD